MEIVRRGLLEQTFMLYSNPYGRASDAVHHCNEGRKLVQVQNVQYDISISRSNLKQI